MAARPQPRDDRASGPDGTRERILDVALPLLLESGYEGTSLKSIAEASGVSAPALYWHFSSKSELCTSVVAREYERFSEAISAAVQPGPPDAQLRAYVTTFVRYQLERRRASMGLGLDILVASLPLEGRARIAKIQRVLHDQLRGIVEKGRELKLFSFSDATVAAFAITTMCNYVFTWYRRGGRLSVDEVAEGHADLAIRLLGSGSDAGAKLRGIAERRAGDPGDLATA